MGPSSWMKYILLSRADYEHQDAAILAHERGHVAARHSWDVLFTDVLTAFQWFNPAIWMLRSDLRSIHEYEADAAVLRHGINARQYQYLLIRKTIGGSGYSVANGFSHSALKNRITMMLKSQSPRMRSWKALFVFPIAALALVANAKIVTDYRTLARQASQPSALAVQEAAKALPEAAALPSDTSGAKPAKGGQDKKVVYYLNGVRQQNGDAVKALKPDLIKSVDVIGSDKARETMVNVVTKDFDESKAPKVKVQGKVVDENGQVVIGAIVRRSGTNIGTVTGPDGKFVMTDVPSSVQLEVAYIGLATDRFAALQWMDNITVTLKKEKEKPAAAAQDDKAAYEVDGVPMPREQIEGAVKPDAIESVEVEKSTDGKRVVKLRTRKRA